MSVAIRCPQIYFNQRISKIILGTGQIPHLFRSSTSNIHIARCFGFLRRKKPLEIRGISLRSLKLSSASSPSKMSSENAIVRAWNNYLRYTDENPLRVQAATQFIFAAVGNLIAQLAVEKRGWNIDWGSCARFSAIALFYTFPIVRAWLWILETKVKPSRFAPIKRVILDQFLFAPINYVAFIAFMGFVEGGGWEEVKKRLKNDYWDVMFTNWKVWPFVQLVNFYFVPFNQRILFLSVISLFWNTYMAYIIRRGSALAPPSNMTKISTE